MRLLKLLDFVVFLYSCKANDPYKKLKRELKSNPDLLNSDKRIADEYSIKIHNRLS